MTTNETVRASGADEPQAHVEFSEGTRKAMALFAGIAWVVIAIPMVSALQEHGLSVAFLGYVANFVSFFTIWTNTAVALALTAPLVRPDSTLGRFFRRPGVITGLAASIAFVAIVYELLLRGEFSQDGLDLLVDIFYHYLIPLAFVGYWWVVTPMAELQWSQPVYWLSYPLAYTLFVLVRGELVGSYPYPFLDVTELGYPTTLLNFVGVGLFFVVLSVAFVAVGRFATRRGETNNSPES